MCAYHKTKTTLLYESVIVLPGIYPKDSKTAYIFIGTLFIIVKVWSLPRYPPAD